MLSVGRTVAVLFLAVLAAVSGCTTPPARSAAYSVVQAQTSDTEAAFQAAEVALVELGYVIERREAASGVLRGRSALNPRDASGHARLSSRGEWRRIGEVRLEPAAGEISLCCRVLVQERTSQAHRTFFQDEHGDDAPTDTPIDREAGTTARQIATWRTVRRDKGAERRILDVIARRTGQAGSEFRD